MNSSTRIIAVTLCCSEEDLARVRSLAATFEREALDVQICTGVDLDAGTLQRHMAQPRSPGVFVMCESLDLDEYQLPQLEELFEDHKLELDQLARVNLDTDSPEQMLEHIQLRVVEIADQEQQLAPAPAKPADIADAIALAKRLVEEDARTSSFQRAPVSDEAPTQAFTRVPEPEPAPEALASQPEPEPTVAPEPPSASTSAAAARPAERSGRGGLVAVAAVLALAVLGGVGYYVWDQGLLTSDSPEAESGSQAQAAPPAPVQGQAPSSVPQTPPEDAEVLANAGPGLTDEDPATDVDDPPEDLEDADELDEPEDDVEVPAVIEVPNLEPDKKEAVRVSPKLGTSRELDGIRVAPVTDHTFRWRDASNHCRLHRREGKLGWRLASIKQLEKLNRAGMLEPGHYWSTTLAIVGSTKNFVLDSEARKRHGEEKTEFAALAVCVLQ